MTLLTYELDGNDAAALVERGGHTPKTIAEAVRRLTNVVHFWPGFGAEKSRHVFHSLQAAGLVVRWVIRPWEIGGFIGAEVPEDPHIPIVFDTRSHRSETNASDLSLTKRVRDAMACSKLHVQHWVYPIPTQGFQYFGASETPVRLDGAKDVCNSGNFNYFCPRLMHGATLIGRPPGVRIINGGAKCVDDSPLLRKWLDHCQAICPSESIKIEVTHREIPFDAARIHRVISAVQSYGWKEIVIYDALSFAFAKDWS